MRLNPHKRVQQTRIVITRRDGEIIRALDSFRFLTREMIQQIIGWDCISKVNARLRKLFNARYLDRRFLPVLSGSPPAIYLLGAEGVNLLAREDNKDKDVLTRNRYGDKNYSNSMMKHALGISEFATSVTRQCRVHSDLKLLNWYNERDLHKELNRDGPKPDGFFRIAVGESAYDNFIEFDTGSESRNKLKKKLEAYREFLQRGDFQRFSALSGFHLLLVTSEKARARSLSEFLYEPVNVPVRVSDITSIAKNPVFGKVWLTPQRSESVALHRPPLVRKRT